MKKQTIFTLFVLSSLLSACPGENNSNGNASSSPSQQASGSAAQSDAPAADPGAQPAPAAGLKPLTAFPKEHLTCCWDDLVKADAQYATLALNAANDKSEDLEKLLPLSLKLTLTPSYSHGAVLAEVLNRIGDARFAWVLKKLDFEGKLKTAHPDPERQETLRDSLRVLLEGGFSLNTSSEVHQHHLKDFPETAKVLMYVTEGQSL